MLVFINNILHKFEIEFDSIDSLICIDEETSYLNVFIPCIRAALVYRTSDEKLSIDTLKNIDEEYIEWERTCVKNIDWSVKLRFRSTDKIHLIKTLQNICLNRVLFCNIKTVNQIYSFDDLRNDLYFEDFSSKYYLECLLSQYYSISNGKIGKKFAELLNSLKKNEIKFLIEKILIKLQTNNRFLSLDTILKPILIQILMIDDIELDKMNGLKYYKIQYIKHAVLTPSRIIYYLPEPNVSNRVLREYNPQNFLCLRIRDENLRKLNMSQNYTMSEIYNYKYE